MMRASGILLPISSIPSNYGIGCFSKEAYAFVDQLAEEIERINNAPVINRENKRLSCHLDLPDTGIPLTSLFPHLQEILISLIWRN